eukprot:tig00020629_g12451.t1
MDSGTLSLMVTTPGKPVFFSYVPEDEIFVQQLVADLRMQLGDVIWDRRKHTRKTKTDAAAKTVIVAAISKCKVAVCVMSREYCNSRAAADEVQLLSDQVERPHDPSKRIVVMTVKLTTLDFPDSMKWLRLEKRFDCLLPPRPPEEAPEGPEYDGLRAAMAAELKRVLKTPEPGKGAQHAENVAYARALVPRLASPRPLDVEQAIQDLAALAISRPAGAQLALVEAKATEAVLQALGGTTSEACRAGSLALLAVLANDDSQRAEVLSCLPALPAAIASPNEHLAQHAANVVAHLAKSPEMRRKVGEEVAGPLVAVVDSPRARGALLRTKCLAALQALAGGPTEAHEPLLRAGAVEAVRDVLANPRDVALATPASATALLLSPTPDCRAVMRDAGLIPTRAGPVAAAALSTLIEIAADPECRAHLCEGDLLPRVVALAGVRAAADVQALALRVLERLTRQDEEMTFIAPLFAEEILEGGGSEADAAAAARPYDEALLAEGAAAVGAVVEVLRAEPPRTEAVRATALSLLMNLARRPVFREPIAAKDAVPAVCGLLSAASAAVAGGTIPFASLATPASASPHQQQQQHQRSPSPASGQALARQRAAAQAAAAATTARIAAQAADLLAHLAIPTRTREAMCRRLAHKAVADALRHAAPRSPLQAALLATLRLLSAHPASRRYLEDIPGIDALVADPESDDD